MPLKLESRQRLKFALAGIGMLLTALSLRFQNRALTLTALGFLLAAFAMRFFLPPNPRRRHRS